MFILVKPRDWLFADLKIHSEDEVRGQMEVNFYGPMRAVRACLPVMRAKGSGHIILISSGAGYVELSLISITGLGPQTHRLTTFMTHTAS